MSSCRRAASERHGGNGEADGDDRDEEQVEAVLVGSSSEDETARSTREHARNIRPARNRASYQTLHTLAVGFTMGWPGLQENASANSGMFTTTPLMR